MTQETESLKDAGERQHAAELTLQNLQEEGKRLGMLSARVAQQREADAVLKRPLTRDKRQKAANRPQERNWMRSEKNWRRWAMWNWL